MRIIAGEYKGRKLKTPEDLSIRPTTDKVKEAIFSMLMNDIYDAVALDLFAGTGNLGLEALSRGARKCYFGDNSKDSLRIVKNNIEHCKANDKAIVVGGTYEKVLYGIKEKVDIIFLDPPYREGMLLQCIDKIEELDILNENGIVIAEHGTYEELPIEINSLKKEKSKMYGKIRVDIYRKD